MINKRYPDQYQYLFIGGLLGELVSLPWVGKYFNSNIKALKEEGAKYIDVYQPHSFYEPEKNANHIHEFVLKMSERKLPLIIFAHSKGCLEILWAMAHHHDKYAHFLEEAILVQPPLKGCAIIDRHYLRDYTHKISKFWPGLHSLRDGTAGDKLKDFIEDCEKRKNFIEKKVTLIKATKPSPHHVSWPLKIAHKHLYHKGLKSDGFLSLEDQSWDNFNWREVILSLDHGDLFTNEWISRLSDTERKQVLLDLISLKAG